MAQEQALRKNPLGGDDPATQGFKAQDRKAPESKDVLKQLDGAIKDASKMSREDRKRQILKRCGCL